MRALLADLFANAGSGNLETPPSELEAGSGPVIMRRLSG